jgi:TetR/AcrR family transcriptional regulator, mexJK operon transcriptional repressor
MTVLYGLKSSLRRGGQGVKLQTIRYGQIVTAVNVPTPDNARSDRRRRAILDVARETFLKEGYAAASMSEIAARLGGSKGTLYNYFRSKEELFAAFMDDACRAQADEVFDNLPPIGEDLRGPLIALGSSFFTFLLSEPVVAIHRLVVAESGRFPEVGRVFYETGPKLGEVRLADYFALAMEAGLMRRCDAIAAARRFKDLCLSDVYSRRLWGVIDPPGPAEIRATVTEGVEIFLAAYGPASSVPVAGG